MTNSIQNQSTENIALAIEKLLVYALRNELISPADRVYARNLLIECLNIQDFKPLGQADITALEAELQSALPAIDELLKPLLDYAAEQGLLLVDSLGGRDLFDAKLMGLLLDRPSAIIRNFEKAYEEGPQTATYYYYNYSLASNYIRKARTDQNRVWQVDSPYGPLDITINLSKPEKDPKEIEAEKHAVQSSYPLCLLCSENEGYMGRINHPGRQNHRIIPMTLAGEPWFFQYSPYAYYNEHAIALSQEHRPMVIERKSFERLLDFVKWLPHYFVGSNADLPIVGGSILSHDHFQGGRYEFPMDRAKVVKRFEKNGVMAEILHWPLSVLRIKSENPQVLVDQADEILEHWKTYSDPEHELVAHTHVEGQAQGIRHNTITPVARFRNGFYELNLVLRNNRTSEAHPEGIFHPHREIQPVKKENIGLIEVMGLAVLPARLDLEMNWMVSELLGEPLTSDQAQAIEKHQPMIGLMRASAEQQGILDNAESLKALVMETVGTYFANGLEHSGVFKTSPAGLDGFTKFVKSMGWTLTL